MRSEGPLRRALLWSFAMNWGRRGLATLFTLVLAGMLGPRVFGVVAMALVYIALVELFFEQGLSTAIIQREDLDEDHLHSSFWLSLAWGISLAGISIGLSGWWARANDLPELKGVISALSATVVVGGLTLVQRALLERRMEFRKLAYCANATAICGGITGVVLAALGAGVWAIVAQHLTMQFMWLVMYWVLARYVPRFRLSRSHAWELFRFSGGVFLANLGGFMNRRADALLIGLFFGPVVVGIYRLADRLVDTLLELLARPVGVVSLPHFSRLQSDPGGLREAVQSCMRVTLLATVPAMFVLAACGDHVLRLLGAEWVAGADALKLLAVVGAVKAVVFVVGPLLFALARPLLRAGVMWVLALYSAGVVAGVGVVLSDSTQSEQLIGMSASRAIMFILVFLPVHVALVVRLTGLPMRRMLGWFPAPLLSGGAALAAGAAIDATGLPDRLPAVAGLALALIVAVPAALATLFFLEPQARREARRMLERLGWRRRLQPTGPLGDTPSPREWRAR